MSQLDQHTLPLEIRLKAIGSDGYVTADEVLFMRRTVFADGIVSANELDALFALGDRAPEGDLEWPQFFAEAVADFYLREEEPNGYLTTDEFTGLKARITRNGYANGLERMVLVKLMETAIETPKEMSVFAGDQIKASIMGKPGGPCVDKADAMMIRRWLFASGGDANVAVTKNEAELLFVINDAVRSNENNPAWGELFVQGVINHLMASLGYTAPSRDEAFRRAAWINDQSPDVGGFFNRMVSGVADAFKTGKEKTVYRETLEAREIAGQVAEEITPEEATWLADKIGRDGTFDENEQRLIARMKELDAKLPDSLRALTERAA